MERTMERTVEIGRARVEIAMTYYNKQADLDGYVFETKEIAKITKAKLYIDGNFKNEASEGFIYLKDGDKCRFGNILITATTGQKIIDEIKIMHTELSKEFGIKTEEEIKKEREIKRANRILTEAATRTNILSDAEEKTWRTQYNNINNEGGEGYVPSRVTLEDVARANAILGGQNNA